MQKSKTIKIGWIGVRGYGQRFWNAVKDSPSFNVVACLHHDAQVVKDAAARMECKPFTDVNNFFELGDFEAIVLTVPNEFHFEYAKKALEVGKHTLVEKPLTNTYEEAKVLIQLALDKGLVLMVGHDYRKSDFIVKMKKELEKGRIGKIVAAEFNMGHGGGLKFGPQKWRFHRKKCPGGPLNMLGTHSIDAANYFFGKVKKVNGIVKNLYASTTAQDMALIQLEYESGVVVNIANLYNSVSTEFINIYGTKGALRFSRWPKIGLWFQPKDIDCDCAPYEEIPFNDNNSARELFEDFLRAVSGKGTSNMHDALETVRIMEEALKLQEDNK